MLKKLFLLCVIACFVAGTTVTVGCGGPTEPVIDMKKKDLRVGEKGKKGAHSDHDGAVQVD